METLGNVERRESVMNYLNEQGLNDEDTIAEFMKDFDVPKKKFTFKRKTPPTKYPLSQKAKKSNVNKENEDPGLDVCGIRTTDTFLQSPRAGLEHLPGASGIIKTREKPGRQFMLRLNIHLYSRVRRDLLSYFETDDLVTYVIGVERSPISDNVSHHAHVFLEFAERHYLRDVLSVASCITDGQCDVQACRSKKSAIKYCTKEDKFPLFNCKLSDTHFNYRVFVWASNSKMFNVTDDFVVEHRFCYRFLERYHAEMKRNSLRPFSCFNVPKTSYMGWPLEVVEWWGNMLINTDHKAPMLYLCGPSNTGKTTLIEQLIGKHNMDFVFYPSTGKFAYQSLNCDFHRIVLFEEFDYEHCNKSMLKRLLERKPFPAPVKCGLDKIIDFKGLVIMVSNDMPPNDPAIRNRLRVVIANVLSKTLPPCPVPKVEVPEDLPLSPEILVISSDEETCQESLQGAAPRPFYSIGSDD